MFRTILKRLFGFTLAMAAQKKTSWQYKQKESIQRGRSTKKRNSYNPGKQKLTDQKMFLINHQY